MAAATPPPPAPAAESSPMQRRVGPFPVWIWIVGVGGVAFFMYRRNKAAASQNALGGVSTVSLQSPTDLGSTVGPAATAQTLQGWALSAENAAVAHNVSPALASKAIGDYLAENQLSTDEANVLNQMFSWVGFPPEILPFNGKISSPAQPPPPPPPPGKQGPIAAPPNVHMLPGERIVSALSTPEYGNSAGYYLTNQGGVYAVGGAPFKFSGFSLGAFNPKDFTSIVDLGKGKGYELVDKIGRVFGIDSKGHLGLISG